jgi:hypothetical protein
MPTVPVAYETSARNTYESRVRRALFSLGSKDPDADIEATHAYLKHCKSLKLDPAVTAAGIYTTVHHRHEPTSVLRGAEEDLLGRQVSAEAGGGYKNFDAFTPGGEDRKVQFYAQRQGLEMLGYPTISHDVWRVWVQYPEGTRNVITVPNREVQRVWDARSAGASEAPTGGEWEVTIRRQGTIEKLVQAAGRKPDEIIGQNVMFGEFYDDEKAQAFAQKMMRAGYFSMYGPRRKMEAASGAAEASRYGRRRGSYVDPQEQERLERGRKRQAEYWEKKEKLTSGLTRVSAEDLIYKYKRSVPESGRETVAVLSDPKTNEPQAILWKWEGWGYGESCGISMNYWLLPGILPAGAAGAAEAPRKKRGVARDSAPCNRLERGGVTGDCSALAKEIGSIETDKDLYRLFAPRMKKETQEVFYCCSIDVHGMICGFTEVARGQVSAVHVTPTQIIQCVLAIRPQPSAFGVAHNHPSGKATPSDADRKLTKEIKDASAIAMKDVVFLDHLVIGGGSSNEYYSFTDGKLKRGQK